MTTVISRTAVRFVVPIILVTSIALLLQGHNLPGGGFIAAVLTATAFVLIYVVFGLEYLRTVLDMPATEASFAHSPIERYRQLIAIGLALAVGAGLAPIVIDASFLTQTYYILHDVPLYHELEVATALAFDVGVYLTVVGALLTMIAVVGTE